MSLQETVLENAFAELDEIIRTAKSANEKTIAILTVNFKLKFFISLDIVLVILLYNSIDTTDIYRDSYFDFKKSFRLLLRYRKEFGPLPRYDRLRLKAVLGYT